MQFQHSLCGYHRVQQGEDRDLAQELLLVLQIAVCPPWRETAGGQEVWFFSFFLLSGECKHKPQPVPFFIK